MCDTGTSFVSIGEAASLLATTELRVLMLLKNKQLKGKLLEESWFIDRSSLNLCERPTAGGIVKTGCGGGCSGRCEGA